MKLAVSRLWYDYGYT